MSRHPSLERRLIVSLIAAQLVAIVLVGLCIIPLYAVFNLDDAGITMDDWAANRAERLVVDSIVSTADGPFIEPSLELRAYLRRFPKFKFAALVQGGDVGLPGSSEDLVVALKELNRLHFRGGGFGSHGLDAAAVNCEVRPRQLMGSSMLTAFCNHQFAWDDLFFIARDYARSYFFSANGMFFLPPIAASLLIVAIVARRGLAPLRRAAEEAARIDLDSLAQRLPEGGMPAEIMPLVAAINGALARLDAGVARQRRFAANAAHELRTPIAILRARVDNPEEARLREDLRRNLRRMRTIVEQLLALTRLNEGHGFSMGDIDLAQTLLPIVADYMPLVVENGRRIDFEAPEFPVTVKGDRRALESIVSNLIDNALKAEPKGGSIHVRILPPAVIEVADHGGGVAPHERELIFEPFWRKNDAAPGTGLGLAIVKELVSVHQGRIWIEDTQGGGATFKIALPAATKASSFAEST